MKIKLYSIYKKLYRRFGPQRWWPAETPFEVMVGALLTQNTNWGNVERAIVCLKKNRSLELRRMHRLSRRRLAMLIRPAGYYNIKAQRLKNLLDFLIDSYGGDLRKIRAQEIRELRRQLLSVNGIGPETADSILLYALNKPVFVVDAYTRRIFSRHGLIGKDDDYDAVQKIFMQGLNKNIKLFNEYHALLVRLGKEFCLKRRPKCEICPLKQGN